MAKLPVTIGRVSFSSQSNLFLPYSLETSPMTFLFQIQRLFSVLSAAFRAVKPLPAPGILDFLSFFSLNHSGKHIAALYPAFSTWAKETWNLRNALPPPPRDHVVEDNITYQYYASQKPPTSQSSHFERLCALQ